MTAWEILGVVVCVVSSVAALVVAGLILYILLFRPQVFWRG
jgi:hypothetical protein